MELPRTDPNFRLSSGLVRLMSFGFRKNFEEYARRCLELARYADTERRGRLLRMARDYLRAAKEGEHRSGMSASSETAH
jgi:hypothetical protein